MVVNLINFAILSNEISIDETIFLVPNKFQLSYDVEKLLKRSVVDTMI